MKEIEERYNALLKLFEDLSKQMQSLQNDISTIPQHEAVEPASEQVPNGELKEQDVSLVNKLDQLTIIVQEQLAKTGEISEQRLERLENIMQNVQEDRYRKDKSRLINRCIYQAGLIRKTIYEYPSLRDNIENKEEFLLEQLSRIVNGIEESLVCEGVKICNFASVGEKVNPEYQEVVETIPTKEEKLNNTIAQVINPGYVWTLPYILKARVNENGEEIKTYRYLIQAEQVVAYKLLNI